MRIRVSRSKILVVEGVIFIVLFFMLPSNQGLAQTNKNDTLLNQAEIDKKHEQFYDSLAQRAQNSKLGNMLYDFLISPPQPLNDNEILAQEYYSKYEGKIISEISITPLDVFGPTFSDTSRNAKNWLEKTANKLHRKSNLNTIDKLLLFEVGDFVDANLMYENQRIIRSLPYIQDVRIILMQDSVYKGLVSVHVITKDRFSFGVSGGVNGGSSAALQIYNQNIFGIGHEISVGFIGSLNERPYTGLETFYKINNIRGKFINITAGYMNNYERKGFSFVLDKPFITSSIKWGYGGSALRMYKTNKIFDDNPIKTADPLNYSFLSAWAGRSFQIKPNYYQNSQVVISAALYNRNYFKRPVPGPENNQYFSNNTFYLTGLTFTQRRYIQDQLVYSYGITEDIPEGFKNEIVYGFDANEFGDRHYAHLYLSNGNILANKEGYLYLSGGIGGYFKNQRYEQGQIQGSLNFISKQIPAGKKRSRLFAHANYLLGIRRFDIEKLTLCRDNHIRGFSSQKTIGKQRFSLNLEYVLFIPRQFYRFNIAPYGFADLGIIGSNKKLIFTENYYTGLGFGVRLHNEYLVFKTFHLRFAFYPFPPSDMSFTGFIIEEQLKRNFYKFEPEAPRPLQFK